MICRIRFARVDFTREARWLTAVWVLWPAVVLLLAVVVPWLARLWRP
jgi:hypothetical protein